MTNNEAIEIVMSATAEAYQQNCPLLYLMPPFEQVERLVLDGIIHMHEPEPFEEYDYESPKILHTIGFVKVFGKEAMTIAVEAFKMIYEKYGTKAEFMICFEYEYPNGERVEFRIVNDIDVVTILLPCEI